MDSNATLAVALTLMSFALPLTAAIATRRKTDPHKNGNGYTTRELSAMETTLNSVVTTVGEIKAEVGQIWKHIKPV